MRSQQKIFTRALYLIPIALGTWWTGLVIVTSDFSFQLTHNLPDDAFYYFVIARNIWQLGRVSFDGLVLSNGFHPLWMLAVLPAFLNATNLDQPVVIVGALSTLLHMLAVTLLYRILKQIKISDFIAFITITLYGLNPAFGVKVLNGLETPLVIVTALLWLSSHLSILKHRILSWREAVRWGICASLVFLSRTDWSILLLLGGIQLLIVFHHRIYDTIMKLSAAALVTFILIFPWFYWNYLTFGSIAQSSGYAVSTYLYRVYLGKEPTFESLFSLWSGYAIASIGLYKLFLFFAGLPVWVAYILAIAIASALIAKRSRLIQEIWRRSIGLWPVLIWPFIYISGHFTFRLETRPWYHTSVIPFIFLGLGITLQALWHSTQNFLLWRKRLVVTLYVGIVAAALYAGYIEVKQHPDFLEQQSIYTGGQWLNKNVPRDSIVGTFNAGLLGYIATNFTVVNLDGVVNAESAEARIAYTMDDYLIKRGVCYIADYKSYIGSQYWGKLNPELAALPIHTEAVLSSNAMPHVQGWQVLQLSTIKTCQ